MEQLRLLWEKKESEVHTIFLASERERTESPLNAMWMAERGGWSGREQGISGAQILLN